ncbi:hypothetical protein PISL3812_05438 [Talaromyces islandicus]|uniref:Uncharacterized protein n=1 Tax=Talaromyces islandicus TaxID=28573 RepID=A0A0U1LYJ2_TALIS|nr:hypothetical protein PISL3812_05438 [Talaromyces islandicus]
MFQPDWALEDPPLLEAAYDPALDFTWDDLINLDYEDPAPSFTPTHHINVHDWLDGASAPPSPCAHCSQARLQCLVLRTDAANPNPIRACSSCVALFRECSLAEGEKRQPSDFETLAPVYGHMHGLAEEGEGEERGNHRDEPDDRDRGGADGDGRAPAHARVSSLRRGGRVLRNWFHRHHEYPYPTDEEKDALAHESGLSKRQVSNWFSNARRRHKQQHTRRENANSSSQQFRSGSPMPSRSSGFAPLMMTPMERWQSSPPDSEPVSESAIQNAIVSSQLDLPAMRRHEVFAADDAASSQLTGSSRSSLAGYSESSGSMTSAWSNQSGSLSCDIIHSGRRRRRRLQQQQRRGNHTPAQDYLYQCTFCRYSSKKRHDWARHERSVHVSLESWLCTPDLDAVREAMYNLSAPTCVLCGDTNPSPTHFDDVHDFAICADRPVAERTFGRKDHFWQHLQKFHRCNAITTSKEDVLQRLDRLCRSQQRTQVRSRCGFCQATLQTWDQRVQHLAEHFKQGFRMSQWRGGWGMDEEEEVELRGVIAM